LRPRGDVAAAGQEYCSCVSRFVSFYNGPTEGAYDLGTKPRSRAAYRRSIVPLSG
jgi:hypothetical protein